MVMLQAWIAGHRPKLSAIDITRQQPIGSRKPYGEHCVSSMIPPVCAILRRIGATWIGANSHTASLQACAWCQRRRWSFVTQLRLWASVQLTFGA